MRPSYIKHFDCESKLKFGVKTGYNFITVIIQHKKHHATQNIVPIPQGLEDFIKQQGCNCFSDIYSAVKNSGKFTEYINQSSTKPQQVIKDIWMKHFASKWKKDEDANSNCHKLLKAGELSHIKELPLVNSPGLKNSIMKYIESIDNVPLFEILQPLICLPNICNEIEYFENEETDTLETKTVESLLNNDSELDDVSESGSDDDYYEDSSENEVDKPSYTGMKRLHYFSSVLLENKGVCDTFLSDTKNMKAMTDMLNHFDELSAVGKLYRNGTMDKCSTNTPPPGLSISYSDWVRYQKYDGEILKNIR